MHQSSNSPTPTSEPRDDAHSEATPAGRVLFMTQLDVWHLTSSTGAVVSGGNQSLYNTLRGFAAAGFDVHLLTTATSLAHADLAIPGITVHRVSVFGERAVARVRRWFTGQTQRQSTAPAANFASVLSGPQSLKLWVAFQFTMLYHVIRLHSRIGFSVFYGYEVLSATMAFLIGRITRKVVVTRFQGTELSGLLDGQRRRLWLHYWTHLLAMSRPADLVVMANDGTQGDRLLRYLRQRPDRTRFWINGIDKDRVLAARGDADAVRRDLGAVDGKLLIVTACRLIGWKRVDRALRAVASVRDAADFEYAIIGEGPLLGELTALAKELGIEDRVHFLGPRPHAVVMAHMHACDVYLSTYDLSNLGNPILEAIVCERCIVTLRNGGTEDVIVHDQNGLLLEPNDEKAISDALRRVLTNADERRRLQRGAAHTAAELKTWAERMKMETNEVKGVLRTRAIH